MQSAGFIDAAGYFSRGWQLVRQPGLRRFVLVPLLINIVIFAGIGWFLYTSLTDWIGGWSFFGFGEWWLLQKLQIFLQFFATALVVIVTAYLLTLLANMVGAPFNGLLAERVEAHLTGRSPSDENSSVLFLIKSIPKTMLSEVRKLFYLAFWMIVLLLLGFLPLVNIMVPFLFFVFSAWMYSIEYVDYPMGNHGFVFREVRQTMRQQRPMALGFGAVVAVFSMVPLLNLVVMPVAVAGATALYVEQVRPVSANTMENRA